MDIKEAISKVVSMDDLKESEARSVFDQIMAGNADPEQIASFITALRMKRESISEITGAAKVMREKALKLKDLEIRENEPVLDTCGTGGSGIDTFNVSTATAFVVAACGVKVAKHGNRAASSRCGSADVLEELGVKVDVQPEITEMCLNEINIGFLFAPLFHGAMKHAFGVRKKIAIRTIFNILGPLSNPVGADRQVLGVYDDPLTKPLAEVLKNLGTERAYVVHGNEGLDEASISSETKVSEVADGQVKTYFIKPEDFGLRRSEVSQIKGGTIRANASLVRKALSGEHGAPRDIVLLNSALALMASDKAEDPLLAVEIAKEAIDSGKALSKLEELKKRTNG